ncbi:Zinc finger, FYVE/PHD-type [Pseudocohnilembus persalinus]|uniref:Zinc finger, FYVE/PHD-type n=1 Tax=Pseudocohnilembus persalinus TaxID=266149 RepID=A0A0V0QSP0_PSEPJ|nr:Zinc finger, FYVE/PHD-type [Pseudocohnilembus persalinus]|eukprot:KRX04933.1 Zinc finger, FYVE/PHD-type [Pseudocohnilembus persalinus]
MEKYDKDSSQNQITGKNEDSNQSNSNGFNYFKPQKKLKVFSDAATSSDTDEYEDEIECEKEQMEEKKFIEEFGVQLNKNGYIVEEGDFDEEAENVEDIQQFHRRNLNQQKDELDYFMDEFGDVFQNQGESQESEESRERKRKRKQKKKKKENQKRPFSDIENFDEMSQDSDFIREQKKILEQFQKKNQQSAQQQIKQQNEIESENKADNLKKNKKTNKSDEKYLNKRRKMKIIGNDSDSDELNYEKLQNQQNYIQNENQQVLVQENFSELSILEDEQSSQSNDFNPLLSQDSASGFQKQDSSLNTRNQNNKMNEENEEESKNCFIEESKQIEEDFQQIENKESKQDKAFKRLKKKITQQKEKRKQNSKNQQKQQLSTIKKRKNKHQKPLEPFQESEEINCCICFDKPENQIYGVLKCNHKYCYQCIKDWADVTNQCPMCRTEFKIILKKDFLEQYQQDIKVKNKKQKIPDHYLEEIGGGEQEQEQQGYDDYDAGIENAEDTCYKCNGQEYPENMIVCDLCDTKVCHAMCDDSIEDGTIPAGDWYCHYCREEDENFVEESSFDSSYQN